MKFKYKDKIVTASSKEEAVKKITSDTKKDKEEIEKLKLLLEKYCNFEKITIKKSKLLLEYYIYALSNKIRYEIYISGTGKIEVTVNINVSNDNPTITKSFNFSPVGAIKLDSWVLAINEYLNAVKTAKKLYSTL